jgi:formyl-CoA transferase
LIVEVDHPDRGKFKTVGCPFSLSDSPVEIVRSPLLGEHNAEILQELFGEQADEASAAKDAA